MTVYSTTGTGPSAEKVAPSAFSVQHAIHDTTKNRKPIPEPSFARLPQPSPSRLEVSLQDTAFSAENLVVEVQSKPQHETVLYLAYGSNLQAAKFRGDRGIKPLSQINVQVPSLRLTFDLPGIPYSEPCFANTARRDPNADRFSAHTLLDEKSALLGRELEGKYLKNGWHKGLIGVVYEVTLKDYAHIIATEGGGAGYQDILVDCHPFASSDLNDPVPDNPTLPPFKAHTLFAPRLPEGEEPPKRGGHIQRPDPGYAQASARYLNIITDGAAECKLPHEYQDHLRSLHPYTITTAKQRVGQFVFLGIWGPVVLSCFGLGKMFVDKNGKFPDWVAQCTNAVFSAAWTSYDGFFRPLFGDGERTIGNEDGQGKDDLLALHERSVEGKAV